MPTEAVILTTGIAINFKLIFIVFVRLRGETLYDVCENRARCSRRGPPPLVYLEITFSCRVHCIVPRTAEITDEGIDVDEKRERRKKIIAQIDCSTSSRTKRSTILSSLNFSYFLCPVILYINFCTNIGSALQRSLEWEEKKRKRYSTEK